MATRVIFLDRDGTLNVDHHYVHRWDQWEFTAGAVDALKLLRAAGYQLAIVSNQSGIARGFFAAADVDLLHDQLRRFLADQQAPLDAIAYCPHGADDDCACRKPRPGLAHQVQASLGEAIDYARSWMIGDKPIDVEFGRALGMRTALLTSEYWNPADEPVVKPDLIAPNLLDAARQITRS